MVALKDKHRVHLPERVLREIEDGEAELVGMFHGTVVIKTDVGTQERFYHKREIEFDDDSTYDKWRIGWGSRSPQFPTLTDAKAYIDQKLRDDG